MTKFELNSKKLDRVMINIAILQIIALIIACGTGMYMTELKLYWQEIYIIPIYCMMLFGIILLNKKWCKKIEANL